MSANLPDFVDPPVVEVAMSVQFEELTGLRAPHLGYLWQEFRDRYPQTEEHTPIDEVIERFGATVARRGIPRIEVRDAPPAPRCWFLNDSGTELIQVQRNRLIHNWRKTATNREYPRYGYLKQLFGDELRRFSEFVAREKLGTFLPNQCEITYVNHIIAGNSWNKHADLARVLTVFNLSFSDNFLISPEDAGLQLRFIIPDERGQPIGRLHVKLESGFRTKDSLPMFLLTLTARGCPRGNEIPGVLRFLDIGREWVVRGFTSITTTIMHKEWGRKDVQ